MTGKNGERGFTLLEVLIAVTLLAVMVGVLAGGFHLSVSAWEAGEERLTDKMVVTETVNLINRQIKTARYVRYRPGGPDAPQRLALSGDSGGVMFVSSRPRLHPLGKSSGLFLQKVAYSPAKRSLYFLESRLDSMTGTDDYKWLKMPMAEGMVTSFRMEFLVKIPEPGGEGRLTWVDSFNTGDKDDLYGNRLPEAVRYRIEVDGEPDSFNWPPQLVPVFAQTEIRKKERGVE